MCHEHKACERQGLSPLNLKACRSIQSHVDLKKKTKKNAIYCIQFVIDLWTEAINSYNKTNQQIVSCGSLVVQSIHRSPPISVAGPTLQGTKQFATLRGVPPAFQSQDAINSVSIRPAPSINRPTVAPPRPPIDVKSPAVKEKEVNLISLYFGSFRFIYFILFLQQAPRIVPHEKRSHGHCKSPPPPPIRSISNTNLPTLPLSIAPSAISPNLSSISKSAATSFGGSASNVSTLMNNIVSFIS